MDQQTVLFSNKSLKAKTKNENYTPPCCYFSGELEVVECLPQTFSGGMMVWAV